MEGVPKRRMSYEDFENIQEILGSLGDETEEFVLKYEQKRLANHPKIEQIKRVSRIDVCAGYDIVSFDSLESAEIDRFIEVKSYSKELGFYWSLNEIRVAKQKRKKYYLYLVNRDSLSEVDYDVLMINDPYNEIFFDNSWDKIAQNWYIKKNAFLINKSND